MADDFPTADGPPPDPFEDELVAYLDGELDPDAARAVEDRLERDPDARDRAAELKKAFDLLDYLPKPEPSPTFTTRTLDKLPAVKSGPSPIAQPAGNAARSGSAPVPTYAVSTSMPVPLDRDAPARGRPLLWAVAVCAAVACFAAAGYFATSAARPYLSPAPQAREKEPDPPPAEVDARVAEHLPLYAVADDLAFVTELAKPELFGDDPAVSFDAALKGALDASDRPTGKELDALVKTFRALPAARQAEVVKLDRELNAKEPRERERLFRSLEAYAVWLDRLHETERRAVLNAATTNLRLGTVRDLRERQWLDALPAGLRGKPEQIQLWRDEEATRRDRMAFVRQHADAFAVNRSPWPFDTEAGRKEVQEFARAVLKLNEPQNRRRLDVLEQAEYARTLFVAQRDDAWAWYGLLVYELMHQRPYLPEPADAKLMYSDAGDLPDGFSRLAKKALPLKLTRVRGQWPEFPLQLHAEIQSGKLGPVPPLLPQLGPTHYTEFKEPVRAFATKELFPKLTADERREMEKTGGKWPDYSKRFVELAKKYDLSVPGVTLPFSPKKWDATYGARPAGREK